MTFSTYKKVYSFLLFVLFGFIFISCQSEVETDLIGEWQVIEHNGVEVEEFNPYYHHFLTFNEDNTFKMRSTYFYPDQNFDYKRGWYPRISDRLFKLFLINNLIGTYTYEDGMIKLYDQNQDPFPQDMIYEVKENQIRRVSKSNYAKFVYEKIVYESIEQQMQGEWHLDITSTNKLSGQNVYVNAILRIKVFNDYISFYSQFSSTSSFSLKFYPGENKFLILNVDSDELITGYIVGNAMHIEFESGIHLVYIKSPDS